ncbi:MAG: ureidoglycolate lyase [Rhodobacteraceae bacterium]|nr:ureidoglycolate lyase [Paracoccaceae bacterium]
MSADDNRDIVPQPLTAAGFAAFGDVLEDSTAPVMINDGMCRRHGDLAGLDFDSSGRGGISLFVSKIRTLPYEFELLERHPLGSQAFLPMDGVPFLVIAAAGDSAPGRPVAFETDPYQGVNFHRNVWHGVLTPLGGSGRFAVVDWIGDAGNLQTHRFERPYRVVRSIRGAQDS